MNTQHEPKQHGIRFSLASGIAVYTGCTMCLAVGAMHGVGRWPLLLPTGAAAFTFAILTARANHIFRHIALGYLGGLLVAAAMAVRYFATCAYYIPRGIWIADGCYLFEEGWLEVVMLPMFLSVLVLVPGLLGGCASWLCWKAKHCLSRLGKSPPTDEAAEHLYVP